MIVFQQNVEMTVFEQKSCYYCFPPNKEMTVFNQNLEMTVFHQIEKTVLMTVFHLKMI